MDAEWRNVLKQNVSRETFSQIQSYIDLLKRWNTKISLISKKITDEEIYFHILDAVVLAQYLPDKNANIMDIGSGNGIPGIVLSIMGYNKCYLIDSNTKKAIFLSEISCILNLNAVVVNHTIDRHFNCINTKPDFIISKAMCSISKILQLTSHICLPHTEYMLYKNSTKINEEITEAKLYHSFQSNEYVNQFCTMKKIVNIKLV